MPSDGPRHLRLPGELRPARLDVSGERIEQVQGDLLASGEPDGQIGRMPNPHDDECSHERRPPPLSRPAGSGRTLHARMAATALRTRTIPLVPTALCAAYALSDPLCRSVTVTSFSGPVISGHGLEHHPAALCIDHRAPQHGRHPRIAFRASASSGRSAHRIRSDPGVRLLPREPTHGPRDRRLGQTRPFGQSARGPCGTVDAPACPCERIGHHPVRGLLDPGPAAGSACARSRHTRIMTHCSSRFLPRSSLAIRARSTLEGKGDARSAAGPGSPRPPARDRERQAREPRAGAPVPGNAPRAHPADTTTSQTARHGLRTASGRAPAKTPVRRRP